jgi:hypothetical protein
MPDRIEPLAGIAIHDCHLDQRAGFQRNTGHGGQRGEEGEQGAQHDGVSGGVAGLNVPGPVAGLGTL